MTFRCRSEEVLSRLLQTMLNERLSILELNNKNQEISINLCGKLMKEVKKDERKDEFSRHNNNHLAEEKEAHSRGNSKNRTKLLTPIRTTRKSVSKDKVRNLEHTSGKKEKMMILLKSTQLPKLKEAQTTINTGRNRKKSPKRDDTIETIEQFTREDIFDTIRGELKGSRTLKSLADKSKIKFY